MDYTSTPITATFPPGANSITVSIPVMSDDVVEGTEEFSLNITIPSSQQNFTLGRRAIAVGQIIDSTG